MHGKTKYLLVYIGVIGLLAVMAINLAQAQETRTVMSVEAVDSQTSDETYTSEDAVELDQGQLDQILAPIALYPDTVLSHILVASTYPLELVQAQRWREQHADLDENEALNAVDDQDWDPSVKALVPFADLLAQLTADLNWLQDLGDAFLTNENQVLTSVQALRQKAYANGSLNNSKYIEVVEEDDNILIQPVDREIIYVPYYDTRVVYGNWWWNDYPPYYWNRPAHYYWHAGLYWSPRLYLRHSVFDSGFHWHTRHVVVHNYYPRRHANYDDGRRRVSVREYQRWNHDPEHRRGVRYRESTAKSVYKNNNMRPVKVVRSADRNTLQNVRPAQVKQRVVSTSTESQRSVTTQQRLNQKLDKQQQVLAADSQMRTDRPRKEQYQTRAPEKQEVRTQPTTEVRSQPRTEVRTQPRTEVRTDVRSSQPKSNRASSGPKYRPQPVQRSAPPRSKSQNVKER